MEKHVAKNAKNKIDGTLTVSSLPTEQVKHTDKE
jgi:hypothetical protein